MKFLSVAFACIILLASCATHTPIHNIAKAPDIVEKVVKIDPKPLIVSNAKDKVTIDNQRTTIESQVKLIDKIQESENDEIFWMNFENDMILLERNNNEIAKDNETLKKSNNDSQQLIRGLNDAIASATNAAILIQSERDQLRDNLNTQSENLSKLEKRLLKSEKIASSAKVYRNWIWCLAGGFIAWTIIRNLLMLYFPLTKFRI